MRRLMNVVVGVLMILVLMACENDPGTAPTVTLSVLDHSDTDEDEGHIKLGIELNGTTFADEKIVFVQLTRSPDKDISAGAGFVYVDKTHAYIIENMEHISEDITVSFTVDHTEITYSKDITSNSIVIKKPAPEEVGIEGVVTVGDLMWEDINHTREVRQTWGDANTYCSDLTLGNFSDWRLPKFDSDSSINELGLIMSDTSPAEDGDDRVINEPFVLIKASDNIASWTDKDLGGSHVAGFFTGGSDNFDGMGDSETLYVRCVRDVE